MRKISFSFSMVSFGTSSRREVLRVGSGNLHCHVTHKALELIGFGHKVRFTVYFYEHADFAAHMNVAGNHAFRGNTAGFFGRRSQAFFTQDIRWLFQCCRPLRSALFYNPSCLRQLLRAALLHHLHVIAMILHSSRKVCYASAVFLLLPPVRHSSTCSASAAFRFFLFALAAFDNGVRHFAGDQFDGADRVVIAGD